MPPPDGSALCVFAHPDDEILAMGGVLQTMAPATIILVTDGAPPWIDDPLFYAKKRRAESRKALSLTGIAHHLHFLGFSDQSVLASASTLITALLPFMARAGQVFTHAFEHGHPDHDAVCLAVHSAAHIAQRHRDVTECPLYRNRHGALVFSALDTEAVMLARDIATQKCAMLDCFVSQHDFLQRFPFDREVYRVIPLRDRAALDDFDGDYPAGIPSAATAEDWRHMRALLEASAP